MPEFSTVRALLLIVGVLFFASAAVPGSDSGVVTLTAADGDRIVITINGQPFATYNYSADLPKPFLLPVQTVHGIVINRSLNDESDPDHPHHKGLWLSIDEVNGLKFWNEDAPIVNRSASIEATDQSAGRFSVVNEWRDPKTNEPQVTETTTITVYPDRMLVYDIQFSAAHGDVVFGDTKEGLLGFRLAPSMKERNGGRITASDGTTGESECWGREFPWIDYSGEVEDKTAGITLMDHPQNPWPSRYHVRGYGLFAINPFGRHAYSRGQVEESPLQLKEGETFRLRYGVYVHEGDAETADVAAAWKRFVERTQ